MSPNNNRRDTVAAFRVRADVFAWLVRRAADSFGVGINQAARKVVEDAFDAGAAIVPTAADDLREQRARLDNEQRKFNLAKSRGEVISRASAFEVFRKDLGTVRSRVLLIAQNMTGLSDEQKEELQKLVEDCMTDLSSEKAESFNDMG